MFSCLKMVLTGHPSTLTPRSHQVLSGEVPRSPVTQAELGNQHQTGCKDFQESHWGFQKRKARGSRTHLPTAR